MSKSHNMPGCVWVCLATNATFVQWILKIKSNIDSGTFRPLQLACRTVVTTTAQNGTKKPISDLRTSPKLAEEIMHTWDVPSTRTSRYVLWGRIPDHYADVEELTEKVLHEARVFITPGFISEATENGISVFHSAPKSLNWKRR